MLQLFKYHAVLFLPKTRSISTINKIYISQIKLLKTNFSVHLLLHKSLKTVAS